jgi:16S rRNA (uracil1498-N3)-methyltransferase
MSRRLLVDKLTPGRISLPPDQAHHARNVLRLREGDQVELFTPQGKTASATLISITADQVTAQVQEVREPQPRALNLTIASAIPKSTRADWMIEKLSELGVTRFIPLKTDRSVVHPEGKSKLQRWQRLAAESAKQSNRPGVMQIAPLTPLSSVLESAGSETIIFPLVTGPDAKPFSSILPLPSSILALIGPEGDWSDAELNGFRQLHLTPITLGATILRVETAAIATAAVVAVLTAGESSAFASRTFLRSPT